MTTTRTFAINTICPHANTTTSTLHRHPKLYKPTETYLFDLFYQEILTVIGFLASGIEHREKLKVIITKIILCVTPLSLPFPKSYGSPTTTSVFTAVVITIVLTHGQIGAFLLACVCTSNRYLQVILRLLKC